MKVQFFITVFFLALAGLALGQDSVATVSKSKYTHIDVGVGYLRTDLGGINRSLAAYGYKPLNENFATVSISAAYVIDRVVLRAEANVMLANSVYQANNILTSFGGHCLGFGIGYAFIQTPKFRFYPFVGINAFVNKLAFEDDAPVTDMDGVFNSPHRSFKMNFSNASLDFGVQIERLIPLQNKKWDCPQNNKFMTVGLRLGYHYGPGEIKGRYNGMNQELEDPIIYSLRGPYAKLVIGLGSKARNLRWRH